MTAHLTDQDTLESNSTNPVQGDHCPVNQNFTAGEATDQTVIAQVTQLDSVPKRQTNLPYVIQVAMPEEAAPFVDANWRVFQLKEAEELLQIRFPEQIMAKGNPDLVGKDDAGEPCPIWPKAVTSPAGIDCFPVMVNGQVSADSTPPAAAEYPQTLLAISKVGLVNSAYTATILAHRLGAEALFSAGTAGGLSIDTSVGQLVFGNQYRLHQAEAGVFGYEPGQVPGMPVSYHADQHWLAACQELAQKLDWPVFSVGEIVSGDTFVTAANVRQVRENYPNALATEMESAAIAQVAWLAGGSKYPSDLPYISLRCISDLCSPDGDEVFHMNVDLAAAISAAFLVELIDLAQKQ